MFYVLLFKKSRVTPSCSPLSHTLNQNCGGRVILGDSVYPCFRNLLTSYKDNGHLSATDRNYNYKLSHSRILIEHVFRRLKQKFRQLYHLKLRNETLICHFIRACCVLYSLTLNKDVEEEAVEENQPDPDEANVENQLVEENVAGQAYRNYCKLQPDYFCINFCISMFILAIQFFYMYSKLYSYVNFFLYFLVTLINK